jgi:DNA-binding transcriptional ArsR family regulator
MKLEQILASSCRQKILLALAKVKKTHMAELLRMIKSTYNQANRNLVILEEEGLIKTRRLGRLRIIELQSNAPRTLAILEALELLDRPIEDSRTQAGQSEYHSEKLA